MNTSIEKQLAAHYDEYKILSQEIQQRVGKQEQLNHLSIIVAGVLLTAFGLALNNAGVRLVLLIFPIMYCMIIWLILRHDVMIYIVVDYLFTDLRPRVNQLLELSEYDSVWLWERFRYNKHLESGVRGSIFHRFLAFIRYGIPFLLSIVSIALFTHISVVNQVRLRIEDITLLVVDILLMAFTFVLMAYWVTQSPSMIKISLDKPTSEK